MQIIDFLSLLTDLSSQVKELSDFLTSDSHVKLGIIIVGLVKPKEKPSNLRN